MNHGLWYSVGAYVLWGLFPIYWKFLSYVPPLQLLSHRIIWSFLILFLWIQFSSHRNALRKLRLTRKIICIYAFAAAFIGLNWLTYIWAVNNNFIIETSLGYFINPLLSVLLGVLFFKERLRNAQWFSVGIATCGIGYLAWEYGSLPWISLTLAFSFAIYGLIKKIAPLGSLYGLTFETAILFVPAFFYLLVQEKTGQGVFLSHGITADILLVSAGLVTSVPLLLFASAAQRIPLSVIGFLQYIAPTLQFLLGVFVYQEAFSSAKLIGFGLVWVALLLFATEGFLVYRTRKNLHRQPSVLSSIKV